MLEKNVHIFISTSRVYDFNHRHNKKQRCKSEFKIPGLYVIDSIIRQSRHQFGPGKDVFAMRFARNLTNTFVHLYKCPDDMKAKIIRVLNL
ncbi:unnamed protein product [Allacma fusca]|uniref:CID domain-containing protein n=1 Tax=Allacma fusca TaxID=39272 RepID=A0A8J2K0Z9_9HEXA|nr:unnamed protein product [Allacma fusca]